MQVVQIQEDIIVKTRTPDNAVLTLVLLQNYINSSVSIPAPIRYVIPVCTYDYMQFIQKNMGEASTYMSDIDDNY